MKQFLIATLLVLIVSCSDIWVVKLEPNATLFREHSPHLQYIGPLSHLPGYHQFKYIGHTRSESFFANFEWAERQVERVQYKRTTDPLYGNQWHLHNYQDVGVNAEFAWARNYTGRGVVIAIVDDGLQHTHPDLAARYVSSLSWDFNDNDGDPTPMESYNGHGTSCAGVCCAQQNNSVCGSGVCPQCTVVGLRLIARGVSDATEAIALAHHSQEIDIYSCSWGPQDDAERFEAPGHLVRETFEQQTRVGRHGKGSIFVWAGGNGREYDDNCNYDGYANSRFTIAVGALSNDGVQSYYSESCSALMAVTPSSGTYRGITTVDLQGSAGYNNGDCTDDFGGTSSATPLAAGVIALLLQARPALTWRDVQHVLAKGATPIDVGDESWPSPNIRGYRHSERYGFGNLVVPKLLDTALKHQLVESPQRILCNSDVVSLRALIPLQHVFQCEYNASAFVEHVELRTTFNHGARGQVIYTLTNDNGCVSHLSELHTRDKYSGTTSHWTFTSLRHWGEQQSRTWTLSVDDGIPGDNKRGSVFDVQLIVYGY